MNENLLRVTWLLSAACASLTAPVHADVTVQQKTSLDVASLIRANGTTTTNLTPDKKREDTQSHCEGMMSLVCGKMQSGEIVRLDRDVTWYLEPDKKRYREQAFATPAETAAMRAKMQANLEKMRSCPVSPKQQPIDKSKCQMSPPKFEVHKTGDRMSIAGHDAQRTSATLTETCTMKDTGDICDTVVAADVWLTQDELPGIGDRRAFDAAYAKKLGLADPQDILRGEAAKFLAPYQSQIKQLTDKSGDFKGVPLKTTLRVLMGGPQCSATAKMKTNESSRGDMASSGNPIANLEQTGKALGSSVGHLVGGLFHKKKADDSGAASPGAPGGSAPANAAAPPPDPFAQYVQVAAFSTETVTVNTDAIPADRFNVPPDWTKEELKSTKTGDDEFTCPKS